MDMGWEAMVLPRDYGRGLTASGTLWSLSKFAWWEAGWVQATALSTGFTQGRAIMNNDLPLEASSFRTRVALLDSRSVVRSEVLVPST